MSITIAIEGGGTRTRAALIDEHGNVLRESTGGPCNPIAYGTPHCQATLIDIAAPLAGEATEPATIAVGLAGARDAAWREHLARVLGHRLGAARVIVSSDVDPLLAANADNQPAILAVAGTGSCVIARNQDGETIRIGGRGTIFGDEGSAYAIATDALRAAAHGDEGLAPPTALSRTLPEAAGCANIREMVAWSIQAEKNTLAALAPAVFETARQDDAVAAGCIDRAAEDLALQIAAAGRKIDAPENTSVFCIGGLFEHDSHYLEQVFSNAGLPDSFRPICPPAFRGPQAIWRGVQPSPDANWTTIVDAPFAPEGPAASEQRGETQPIDRLSTGAIADAMNRADTDAIAAVRAELPGIAQVIDAAANAIQNNGRIIYIGAGTSGRLAVLDAAECPPTFGVSSEQVVAIIAGGERALRESVEGAEDDTEQARRDLQSLQPSEGDLVIGVAASGTTPYTRAALDYAHTQNASTALLCCNPFVSRSAADHIIAIDTGPELVAGSTRLKAGTATKSVLNTLSTGALVRAGYVYSGRMIRMRPINAKLHQRACRILADLAGLSRSDAENYLQQANNALDVALVMARKRYTPDQARTAIEHAASLADLLDSD